jgi:hypothetical protein
MARALAFLTFAFLALYAATTVLASDDLQSEISTRVRYLAGNVILIVRFSNLFKLPSSCSVRALSVSASFKNIIVMKT